MTQEELKSDVTGTVWKVECEVGDRVEEGDVVMILESMKMEIPVEASAAGTISELRVKPGDAVDEEDVVCVVEI